MDTTNFSHDFSMFFKLFVFTKYQPNFGDLQKSQNLCGGRYVDSVALVHVVLVYCYIALSA